MKNLIYTAISVLLLFASSCKEESSSDEPSNKHEDLSYFYENGSMLRVDVAYEPNAEPYINNGFGGNDNFLFTQNNLNDLLSGRSNQISVVCDLSLSEMTAIPAQNKSSFSMQDIRDLSDEYQTTQSTANQSVIFLVYVDGYFKLNDEVREDILGVSVGSFVVAIFKPVISNIQGGGVFGGDPKYMVEQATVTHEVAHALGLVNNGVDLHTSHQDEAHGKHCSNSDCVMYWTVASESGASGLFGSSASVNELVFGQECKDDIANF